MMFKVGTGVATVYDKDYGTDRTVQLYSENEVLRVLSDRGLKVVPPEDDKLGGVMRFTDPKPWTIAFCSRLRPARSSVMDGLPVPSNIREINPHELTEALRSGGATTGASVTRISAEPLTGGNGFMNQVAPIKPH